MKKLSVISCQLSVGVALAVVLLALPHAASACPFCYALKPTLSQQRDAADVVAIAEVAIVEVAGKRAKARNFKLHQVFKGRERVAGKEKLRFDPEQKTTAGQLMLAFGRSTEADGKTKLRWHAVPVTETSLAYFVRSPAARLPAEQRLPYFARYLEHAEPLIADDAYLEFGHTPYDKVRQVAKDLPMEKIRRWVVDPNIPQFRKGFYGLALGLATNDKDREANTLVLRKIIDTPASDFRQGFDGVLAGYLISEGSKGLKYIESRYLADPKSRAGDVRHVLSALRFYYEYGDDTDAKRLADALAKLLTRREFAAEVVTDLARWQHWQSLDTVVSLYNYDSDTTLAIRRAVVGYLIACPNKAANAALDKLRRTDPKGVDKAEQYHQQLRALSE